MNPEDELVSHLMSTPIVAARSNDGRGRAAPAVGELEHSSFPIRRRSRPVRHRLHLRCRRSAAGASGISICSATSSHRSPRGQRARSRDMHEATLRGLRAGRRRRGSVGHPDPRRLGRDGSRTDARRSLHSLLESTAPAPWPWSHADLPELRGAARGRICTVYRPRLSRLPRPLRSSVSASPRCSVWLRSGRALRGVYQR